MKRKTIIIHLPIDPDNFEKTETEKSLLSYRPELIKDPQAFNEDDCNYFSFNKKKVQNENIQTKKEIEKDVMSKIKENTQYQVKLMKDYDNLNKEKRRPDKTNIHCWWDCKPFDGHPIGVPHCKKNGTYYIYGNFCSPECAAAHLFSENISNSEKFKRYEMLHEYYNKINNNINTSQRIELAPNKMVLKEFGGVLSIEDYRNLIKNYNRKITTIDPPIVSVIPTMEVENRNSIFVNHNNVFIPIDEDKIKTAKKELVLKRKKPLRSNTNTLEKVMNLKFKKRSKKPNQL